VQLPEEHQGCKARGVAGPCRAMLAALSRLLPCILPASWPFLRFGHRHAARVLWRVYSTRGGSQHPRRNRSKQCGKAQGGLGMADQG